MLYFKDQENNISCPSCGHPRFKPKTRGNGSTRSKEVSYKSLRYFPITPRLQRLYMSSRTAKHMRWHANKVRHDEDKITHPVDAEAWKHFDRTHQNFAMEVRNVRLGLCTDGFNPFGGRSTPYSCWPVFVTPYNLPPSLCMKRPNLFLSLLIPGPTSPGQNLDVYLRPLIDELKVLWDDGVTTYDAHKKQNFNMKAVVLWTISDFPAYGMLSGWSTHGRLACPYCMEDSKAFRLRHGRKPCWFDCHRRFLPSDHPFRRQKNAFKAGTTETEGPSSRLSGIEILRRLRYFPDVLTDARSPTPFRGFGKDHNWTKEIYFLGTTVLADPIDTT